MKPTCDPHRHNVVVVAITMQLRLNPRSALLTTNVNDTMPADQDDTHD